MSNYFNIESKGNNMRAGIVGLLSAFVFFILKDLLGDPILLIGAGIAIVLAFFLAKKTSGHFHGEHTHAGDSPIDALAIIILFIANIFHPAVDGFSFFETLVSRGPIAGWLFAGGIIVHEFFRQTALIAAFKSMSIKWYVVVLTAIGGILLGVGLGMLGSRTLHNYEGAIDIATLFAYTFIIFEFYISDHGVKKSAKWFVVAGLVIGAVLSLFVKAH